MTAYQACSMLCMIPCIMGDLRIVTDSALLEHNIGMTKFKTECPTTHLNKKNYAILAYLLFVRLRSTEQMDFNYAISII